MSFFENTRKPQGFGGKLMTKMMNSGHSRLSQWGFSNISVNPDAEVLDVGCGSGILSIAAALLGSRDILAIDIDPVAVEVTRENVELNNVSEYVDTRYGDLTKGVSYRADIVVANLMADLVMMLTEDVAKHLEDGGIYISSGIIDFKEEEVCETLKRCGFEIIEILKKGEWCTVAARLKQ